ncbi:MAG: hypothetical protein JSU85_12670 [Candidatus Zixiibacteriota bacterium]|nr:MAG: hypothetical protein JSU85_12670 [candidate division Zixibacteria bacterium]
MGSFGGGLFYNGPDVEILRALEIGDNYESNIKGIYIIGDLSGVLRPGYPLWPNLPGRNIALLSAPAGD